MKGRVRHSFLKKRRYRCIKYHLMKQNYKLCAQYHVYIWFTEVQNMKGYDKNCIPATLILCAAAILDLELIMT